MAATRNERGPYAKGIAKRAEILDAALAVIDREGYSGATVKRLGEEVGLSQNGLLRYFGSKDALFLEILRRRDELAASEIDVERPDFAVELVETLLDAVEHQLTAPGLAQLSLRMTGDASEPDHLAHEYVRERYARIRQVVEDALGALQAEGRLSSDIDPVAVAAILYATWDGLQMQWMYDETVDLRAHMVYLVRALGIASRVGDPAASAR